MKAIIIKNLIISGELKKVGQIIEISTRDFNTFNHFSKHLEVYDPKISTTNNSPAFELDTNQEIQIKETENKEVLEIENKEKKVKKSKKIK